MIRGLLVVRLVCVVSVFSFRQLRKTITHVAPRLYQLHDTYM